MINYERLREALAGSMASQSELARYVGVTPAAIQQLISGKTRRSVHLSKIAKFLNVSEEWLIDETDDYNRQGGTVADYARNISLVDLDTATSTTLGTYSTIIYDIAFLPIDNDIGESSETAFAARWVMFTNLGDDMAPFIRHADHIVVDMHHDNLDRSDAIWLVRSGSEHPMLRRGERLGGNRVRLYADNERVADTETTFSDFTIFGRVIWQSRLWT